MANSGIRVRGITIEIKGDVSGLVDSFKQVDSQLKRTKNNLATISNYIKEDTSWNTLHNKFNALNLQHELLKTQEDELIKKIRLEQEALGSLATADSTPQVVERSQALRTQLILDIKELKNVQQAIKDFGTLAQQKFKAVGDSIKAMGDKLKTFGSELMSTGRSLTTYVTTPIVGLGTAVAKTSMDFETAMDKVQSVTLDATVEEMDELRQMVLDLSGDSKYSATEAAEALYYMGLAGWDTAKMMEALPDVLALATAGDLDLGRASDIVTDYITAFGMSAKDATRFVDVMAKTMVNSNTDVDQLGDAFKYVAPVAGSLGYTVEDVSLALGIMANNGIKASQAGTALRQFMQRLVKPTDEVAAAMDELGLSVTRDDGSLKTFKEVLDNLRESLGESSIPLDQLNGQISQLDEELEEGTLTEEEYEDALREVMKAAYGVKGAEVAKNGAILAGVRGMSGLLAIVNTTAEDYENLSAAINGTEQSAQSIANIMLDNTEGAMLRLKHSVQNLGIAFGEQLLPYVQNGIDKISSLVQWFASLDEETKGNIIRWAGLAAAIGPALLALGGVVSAIGSIMSGFGSLVSFVAMNPVFSVLAVAIGGLLIAGANWQKKMEEIREETYGLSEDEKALVSDIEALAATWDATQQVNQGVIDAADAEAKHLEELRKELGLLADENTGRVIPGYEDRVEYILNELNSALGTEYEMNGNIISSYQGMQTEIENLIAKKKALKVLEQYEEEYAFAQQHKNEAYEQYVEAVAKLSARQEEVNDLKEKEAKLDAQLQKEYAQYGRAISGVSTELANVRNDLAEAQESEDTLREAMETSLETYTEMQTEIKNYDEAYQAATEGTASAANEAITKLITGLKRFDTATEQQLKDQISKYKTLYEQAKVDAANGVAGITQATVDEYEKMVELAEVELEKYETAMKEHGETGAQSYKEGFESVDLEGTGEQGAKDVKKGLTSVEMDAPGSEHMDEYAEGITDNSYKGEDAAEDAAKAAKKSYESVDMKPSGKAFAEGIAKGIKNNIKTIEEAAEEAADSAKKGFNQPIAIKSPSRVMMQSGKYFDEGIAIGIERNAEDVYGAAAEMSRNLSEIMAYNTASPEYGLYGGSGSIQNRTMNLGGVSITINQQPGESAELLADLVMERIERETIQRQMVMAV